MWQRSNFMRSNVPERERPLMVNLDEASVRLYQGSGPGYLVEVAMKQKRTRKSLTRNATKGDLRGSFTHVALISDDLDIQARLPQHAFKRKSQISTEALQAAQADMVPNVHLRRGDDAWVTSDKMKLVFKSLVASIPKDSRRRIVLCADTYKSHQTRSTWCSAAARGIFYFLALQPCDTHLASLFKHHLSTVSQALALAAGDGRLDLTLLLQALNSTIDTTINKRSWRQAFVDLGYRGTQRTVSQRVLGKLELESAPDVSDDVPTLDQLQACFPRNYHLPIGDIVEIVGGVLESGFQGIEIGFICVPFDGNHDVEKN